MKTPITMLVLSLALGVAACGQPSQSPPPPDTSEADATAIRAGVQELVATWNAGENFAAQIAMDAVLLQPDGSPIRGRDSIASSIAQNYDITLLQQTATTDEILVMGNYAYAHGTWQLDPTAAAGADAPGSGGKWSVLYQRAASGWEIARWMWNQEGAAAGE